MIKVHVFELNFRSVRIFVFLDQVVQCKKIGHIYINYIKPDAVYVCKMLPKLALCVMFKI